MGDTNNRVRRALLERRLTGEMGHPEVVAALGAFRETCLRRGVAAGMHIVRPNEESIQQGIEEGYTMIALGWDNAMLSEAAMASLKLARQAKRG